MKKYTDDIIDFLREIAPGKTYKEIVEIFNKKYDLGMTTKKLSSLLKKKGLKLELKQLLKKESFHGTKERKDMWELTRHLSKKVINQRIGDLSEVKELMAEVIH